MLRVYLEVMVASTHSVLLAARYWKGDHWPSQGPTLGSLTPLPHTTQGKAVSKVSRAVISASGALPNCMVSLLRGRPKPLQSTPHSWPRPRKPSRIQHSLSLSCIPYCSLCHWSSSSSSSSAFFSASGTFLVLLPLHPDRQRATPGNPGSAQIPSPRSPGPS